MRKLALATMLYFASMNAALSADDVRTQEFITDGKKCVVGEMSYPILDHPIVFEDSDTAGWCQVRVPVAKYKTLFKFCYVSGISVMKPYDNCQVSVHDKSDGYAWFEFPHGAVGDVGKCTFTCVMR